MPPKRQRQDNDRDSGPSFSTMIPVKKLKTGAASSQRSNQAQPTTKPQTDDDYETEELSSEDEDDSSEPESQQAGEQTGDQPWRLLDNDSRTQLQIGIEAPNRLKLRFQNRDTNKIREYIYMKTNIHARQGIDWSNKDHLAGIMKWRNQIFNRLGFRIRGTLRWTEDEIIFLTLVFEKLALAVEQRERVILPGKDVIFQLFTDAFGSVHDRGSFDSRIRRKDGSRLAQLRDHLEAGDGDLDSEGDTEAEFRPTVVMSELEPYKKERYVRLNFDLTEYQRSAKPKPAVEKTVKPMKAAVKPEQQKSPKGPEASKTTKKAVSKRGKLGNKSALGSSDSGKPSNDSDLVRFLLVVYPESNIRNDPTETATDTYSPLKAQNKWLSVVLGSPAVSGTAAAHSADPLQQPSSRTDERETSPKTEDWMSQATKDLHERIDRLKDEYFLGVWRDSRNEHRASWHTDKDHDTGNRIEGAAAVNALLNAAIVPPVGYHGDVRALVEDRALPADQLLLHEQHASAMRTYHTAHDRQYRDRFRNSSSATVQGEIGSSSKGAYGDK